VIVIVIELPINPIIQFTMIVIVIVIEVPINPIIPFRTRYYSDTETFIGDNSTASAQNAYTIIILRFKNKCFKINMIVLYISFVLLQLH
jgi:hypothetical protein